MKSTIGLCLIVAAVSVVSLHATANASPFAESHLVALQQQNPNDPAVTVYVYDPFTSDGLRSTPLPEWFSSSPSNPLAIDVTSSKATNWIDAYGNGHVAFVIANNDTVPTQAFMDYIYYEPTSGYIEPSFQGACFLVPSPSSPGIMYRDLLLLTNVISSDPITFGATVETIMPDGSFNASQFEFVTIAYPTSGSPTSFPACNVNTNSHWAELPVQLPYSLSATALDSLGEIQWAYISFTNSSSGQISYAISFVPLFADSTPATMPLTGLEAIERFPPPAPWFSLQLFTDPKSTAAPLSFYLANAVDSTVWYVTPGAAAQQLTYQTGKHAKVVVPTLPFVAVPLSQQTSHRRNHHIKHKHAQPESDDINAIVFLWLNDYKQLVGVSPSNESIAIKGVNMPALIWGEKLLVHSDNS